MTTTNKPTMHDRIEALAEQRHTLELGGGEARLAKQRAGGKLTARERVQALLDPGTLQETGLFSRHRATLFGMDRLDAPADGVVTGVGAVLGRPVHFASQDFTVAGGSVGEVHADKVVAMMKAALSTGTPFVFINDSGGARVQEGIGSLSGYGKIFYTNVQLSGVVPQISVVAGPCAGGAAYSPALTDFIIQTRQANMFITGPSVIQQVTGEKVSAEDLGGPDAHMARAGNIHFIADDDRHALLIAKKLLSFLPQNNTEDPPIVDPVDVIEPNPHLAEIIPDDDKKGYDVREVIANIVDRGDFLEVQAGYAGNIVVGFGRVVGRTVGFIANQPTVLAGVLDINASDKASRFIRFCDAFNIPLLSLVDVPGFLPGTQQEYGGIIRHGAKMLYSYAEATVPKITLVLRKSYGGAYLAMCSKDMGADRVFAWPTAEIAVMGAEGAAEIIFKREIESAEDPAAKRREMIDLYRTTFSTPAVAASRGLVDDIIDPRDTRAQVARALEILYRKRELQPTKKHGVGPT
ncbi:acyl-CoA carboxylase subunit beta [Deinococcus enclensis]|uniref:Methylmalonyl-CoA carboxyltransferase large subunit n=1 Tax=Deinococcus enclensis TaxID=1049582 RepID=A0ABT9M8L3_9DEIO|nr:acyl-CoA carboxylase subunit beta [Deinococcus enclensis]MDP9762920.1 methylmalonyl-CoA carboxyltransferase large subunit [Deinococcus enclensis]